MIKCNGTIQSRILPIIFQFIEIAIRNALSDQGPQTAQPKKVIRSLFCIMCPKTFDTAQEISAHMFSEHGVKSSLKERIAGTICYSWFESSILELGFIIISPAHRLSEYKQVYYSNRSVLDHDVYFKLEANEADAVKSFRAAGKSILHQTVPTAHVCGPSYSH